MIANSWHMSVAIVILAVALQFTQSAACSVPQQVGLGAVQRVLDLGKAAMAVPGPGNWPSRACPVPPCHDMWSHWQMSQDQFPHPARAAQSVGPATFKVYAQHWQWLPDLRKAAVAEIESMVEDWSDDTNTWFDGLAPEIQSVYTNNHKLVAQVPLLLDLMQRSGCDGVEQLRHDLTKGFPMTGPIAPGTGWLPRTDGRYSKPMPWQAFVEANDKYVRDKLRSTAPSPHWKQMLEELLEVREKGRVEGPLQAPSGWNVIFPEVQGMQPAQCPTDEAYAAVCFAVVQPGKIRRCEDFRRSMHNATIEASDSPSYTDVEQYIGLVQMLHAMGHDTPVLWLQDLEGAYRQVPVVPGNDSFALLVTPEGPTVWHPPLGRSAVSQIAWCPWLDGSSCASLMAISWTTSRAPNWPALLTVRVSPSGACSKPSGSA